MTSIFAAPTETRVLEILDGYLAELRAGRHPDRDALLARHPDLAESLAASLRALDFVRDAGRTIDTPGSSQESDCAGQVLGDFRLVREIARGGMAVVYEAEQLSLGRRVALKVLPFAAVLDPKQLQRFKNEAQAAAQLQHPHIVPVHAVGCERGVHYYAMQYIEGQSLADVIREMKEGGTGAAPRTPLSSHGSNHEPAYIRRAAEIGVRAAQALDHAHQLGIVHRDVKPGNLLVDLAGTLWVTDFGLACSLKDVGLTMTGELLGTVRYMSPEQALAKRVPVDHRTDVYSLGATLYELFTLAPAFPGEDLHRVLQDVASKEPAPPRQINPGLPRDVETVLLKAMSKDPAGRYATAREMADDLERFLEDRPIVARRPSLARRATMWSRRHRVLVGVAAGVLVLAVAGLVIGAALLWREKEQTQTALARADANLSLALKVLDEIYMDEAGGRPQIREGLPRDLLGRGLEFYEKFAMENAHSEDIALLVGEAYTRASLIYLELGEEEHAEQALERAMSASHEAIQHHPDPARAHVSLGNARWIKGEFDAAIREYDAAIALRPDYADAHLNRGIALLKARNLEGAIGALRRAVHLMPRDASAHNELGMALLKKGERREALRHFQEAVHLRREFAPAYINLGNALGAEGEHDKALEAYEMAARLQPKSAIARLSLGNAFRRRGEHNDAIREYRLAIDCQDLYIAHWNLGCALRDSGDPKNGAEECRKAMQLRPRDRLLHLTTSHMLAASVKRALRVPMWLSGPGAALEEAPRLGEFEGSVNATQFPDIFVTAQGTSTQLGQFTFTLPHHVNPDTATAYGTFELMATNGDKLEGTMIGLGVEPRSQDVIFISETATITGGTGRFAGATGGLKIERLYDRELDTTVGTLAGTISAPHSDN